MDSDWSITTLDGRDDVHLVTVELDNPDPVDRRVRVENRLDGPVLPPRASGLPDPGWDDGGFEGVVPAGGRRTLGYACPAPASRPPVRVSDEGRATDETADPGETAAVRDLGDPRPPADALPDATPGRVVTEVAGSDPDGTESDTDGAENDPETDADGDLPAAVESWLVTVEDRIERGERLTDASVGTATAALEADGDVAHLDDALSADVATLRAVAARTTALAERAVATDVPVEALRRLA